VSVSTVNDAVVVPFLANWAEPVRVRKQWGTLPVSGLTGQEDRAATFETPFRSIEYSILADRPEQLNLAAASVMEALRRGRALVPQVNRPQIIEDTDSTVDYTWSGIEGEPLVYTVPPLRWFYYEHGPEEDRLEIEPGTSAAVVAAARSNIDITNPPWAIEGVTLEDEDPVLLIAQTDPRENGVYIYQATPPLLTRSEDYDSGEELFRLVVQAGSSDIWVCTNRSIPTISEDVIVFSEAQKTLCRSGYFLSLGTKLYLYLQSRTLTGGVRRAYRDQVLTDGLWPWAGGEYVFFIDPTATVCQNKTRLINCGGDALDDWRADPETSGSIVSHAVEQDQSLLLGYGPLPNQVLSCARVDAGTDPAAIALSYTLSGFEPRRNVRLRLHFSELVSGYDRTTAARRMTISVIGGITKTVYDFEPYVQAGTALDKGSCIDVMLEPTDSGTIQIDVLPFTGHPSWVGPCKGSVWEVYLKADTNIDLLTPPATIDGIALGPGMNILLSAQTLPAENGIYTYMPDEPLTRAYWADDSLDFVWIILKVLQGTHIGTFWFASEYGDWTLDIDPLYFTQTTTPYAIGINGIEAYQWAWEVRRTTDYSSTGRIEWEGWLRGCYGSQAVYPMLLGRLEADPLEHLTDYHGRIRIRCQEPPLNIDPGPPHECSPEVCSLPWVPPTPPDDWPLFEYDPTGWNIASSRYGWALNAGQNPNEHLTKDQVDFSMALFAHEFAALQEWSIPTDAVLGDYVWVGAGSYFPYNAIAKYWSGNPVPDPYNDPIALMDYGYFLARLWQEAPP